MTDLQTRLMKAYRMNIGTNLEFELSDNCNPIDAYEAVSLLGISIRESNGLLVSMCNAGYLEDNTDGDGKPLYMFTEKGVIAWYKERA